MKIILRTKDGLDGEYHIYVRPGESIPFEIRRIMNISPKRWDRDGLEVPMSYRRYVFNGVMSGELGNDPIYEEE